MIEKQRFIGMSEGSAAAERRALAAAFRLAVRFDLHESIDNHFSLALHDGRFLINPYGIHWFRLRARDLLIVDDAGRVLEGDGEVEATALHIHAAIHRHHHAARCVLHTHMPYATAIACTESGRLEAVSQTAAIFDGQIAYDDHYGGLGDNPDEGDRLARAMSGKPILFMANHGIVTTGRTVAEAFNALYYLERAARLQVLAASTGRPLKQLSADVVAKTAAGWAGMADHAERHFQALVDILDADEPDYAQL
jgi:ribulose-5-phosphate 4-epimerase/fuculose-1-phosphate aldolase